MLLLLMLLTGATILHQQPPLTDWTDPIFSEPTPVELFMKKIEKMESGGNHTVVNQIGMMGKYQFSYNTIRSLGFNITREQFLSNKELQDSVMIAYMKSNQRELAKLIDKYEGKTIAGVKITRAAILAGAHFAGSGGMRTFLVTGGSLETEDINGTTIVKYIKPFSNFNLPSLAL
jgi:hypothetical protein